jgi:trk system potassium uptake protein TrkA
MHIIVLGCGRIGSRLALTLEAEQHTVAIVDRDREAFRRLPDRFTGRAVLGNVISRSVLEQAGIGEAEAVAAVTSGDNSNIVAARIARETYEIGSVVARIKDPKRAAIYQRLGIPTVATVTWTTEQVARRLLPTRSATDWTHPDGNLHLVERELPRGWVGQDLGRLCGAGKADDGFRLVAVTRAGEGKLAAPGMVGQPGDLLHVLVEAAGAEATLERLLSDGEARA